DETTSEETPTDDDTEGAGGEPAASGGEFSIFSTEPPTLLTGNASDTTSGAVLGALYSALFELDSESGEAVPVVAASADTEDGQSWTITLNDGWTFHNGEPITAQTYVDTWNFMVDPDNGLTQEYYFEDFAGYAEVRDGSAETMSGLSAPDDSTIEVELTAPLSAFTSKLTMSVFYPLPAEAFEDYEAFQEEPIGNGPFMMDGPWEHDVQIAMTRYEDWPGENPPNADRIVWKIYAEPETGYLDAQAGNLDIMPSIPPARIATVEGDFPEGYLTFPSSTFTYLGYPLYDAQYENPDIRRALSMAIDRQAVIDAIFNGTLAPADGPIPPVMSAYREGSCEACVYNPEEAAELYEAAGGPSNVTVWFNSGAGHEEWVEAITNMWQQHLGVTAEFNVLEWGDFLDVNTAKEFTGPFRLGWASQYPDPGYALQFLRSTNSSNGVGYDNPEFDRLHSEAAGAPSVEEANALFEQAEDVVLADMPLIPLWYGVYHSIHSDNVSDLTIDFRGRVVLNDVTVNNG
ncbi:MAG: ABC transporter substrate-binding protein, partial [Actinomycetia bacterium]|nr:ABC transporter substrate-binding protein [Actinomycetes bacterium]